MNPLTRQVAPTGEVFVGRNFVIPALTGDELSYWRKT